MFIVVILFILRIAFAQDPVANLIQGRVVGIKVFLENSITPIEIYFGIPYATPPLGRLRFAPPERHTGWKKTFYAHRMAPNCPQIQNENQDFNENCLYLNIWTSRRVDGQLLPVVVIFYSESWSGGSLNLPCQELAAEGVVVVTVAYRLHFLSFFSLKSVAARGNLALLDQYLALLWVRENISAFGGDPTSVTLLGHSAGADSILHHIVSPRTIGLFHRAILMSPRYIWQAVFENKTLNINDIVKVSRDFAQSMECSADNERDETILKCLQNKPLSELTPFLSNKTLEEYMLPTPDNYLPESMQYLPNSVGSAIRTPHTSNIAIDILIGTTDLDSFSLHDRRYQNLIRKSYKQIYEIAIQKVIPDLLQILELNNGDFVQTLIEAVRWEYWENESKDEELTSFDAVESLSRMDSAISWGVGSYLLAEKLSHLVNRVYMYRFSQPSNIDLFGNRLNFTGAVNGGDLIALLGDAMMLQVARRSATIDEKQISSLFRQYVVNFVKFGSPASQSKWPRFTRNENKIYEICGNDIRCAYKKVGRDISFWLKYLPLLAKTNNIKEQSDRIVGVDDENRLRGGMFAMCGISILLLLMLLVSGLLLHKRRFYRPSSVDSQIAY